MKKFFIISIFLNIFLLLFILFYLRNTNSEEQSIISNSKENQNSLTGIAWPIDYANIIKPNFDFYNFQIKEDYQILSSKNINKNHLTYYIDKLKYNNYSIEETSDANSGITTYNISFKDKHFKIIYHNMDVNIFLYF